MPEHPSDLLYDGITALDAVYGLLLQASNQSCDHLNSVRASSLCVLVRLVQERLEAASDGFAAEKTVRI